MQEDKDEIMNEVKPYKIENEGNRMAAEPDITYNVSNLQVLKSRLMASIEKTTDEEMLEQCLGLLQRKPIPCVYTDEEFVQILAEAEASGYMEHEEALKEFEKWGFVR